MNSAVRTRRLTRLADYLAALPKTKKFDMSTWGEHFGDHDPAEQNYCGTQACALGHAAMIPAFRKQGLKIEWTEHEAEPQTGHKAWWDAEVLYDGKIAHQAGEAFFGLTSYEANDLFYEMRNKSEVIKQIRKLAKQPYTKPTYTY